IFKPAIYNGSVLYELPRPVTALRLRDVWDFERFKVPLAAGDSLVGHSLCGVDVAVEGQILSHAASLTLTEQAMFEALEGLRAMFDLPTTGVKYTFFLYHDAATTTYRKLKNCSTLRFEYDLSDKRRFTWKAEIHSEDPVIYKTAPGL
ncbi:MAG: hypothetical protein KY476_21290, partial [Planctomycetes bacterium]|nr:hypothetical protein [Planctomycetota bacterium]